jgi:hypothetical protein
VYFRGVWSTVCDSEWYPSEAKVLCRSLGCGSAVARPRGLPHSLDGRMYYSCKGQEPALSTCSWRFNNSNLCSQSRAARVVCSGIPSPAPPPLDLVHKFCLCRQLAYTGPRKTIALTMHRQTLIRMVLFFSAVWSAQTQIHGLSIYQGSHYYVYWKWFSRW